MKKIVILIFALAVIGLTAAPQVQAQTAADQQEILTLTQDFQAGKITLPEFQRRRTEIQERLIQNIPQTPSGGSPMIPPQMPQQPPQQAVQQQGEHAGWPPASAFQNRFKITPFTQPAGTTARYDAGENKGVIISLEIYLSGGNAGTALQNLKQQIEAVTGRQTSQDGNSYVGAIQDPNYRDPGNRIQFLVKLENNVVTLRIQPVAD
jgi:hypothetical protein